MKLLDKIDDAILAYSQKVLIARAGERDNRADISLVPQKLSLNTKGYTMGTLVGAQKLARADFNRDKSLNFVLHPAEGGFILELSHYEPNTDRYTQRLHIINDGDNMGDAISKILTLELLRR